MAKKQKADETTILTEQLNKINLSKEWIDNPPKFLDDYIFPTKTKELLKKWLTLEIDENSDKKILNMPNLMLIGYQGLGKTTLANIICNELNIKPLFLNASILNSIDTVRTTITQYCENRSITNYFSNKIDKKIIILDEFDNTTPDAQKALRGLIEKYKNNVRFIATLNFPEKILDPIKSRFAAGELYFDKLYSEHKKDVIVQLVEYIKKILEKNEIEYNVNVIMDHIKNYYPDIRSTISTIQKNYTQNGNLLSLDYDYSVENIIEIIKNGKIPELYKISKDTFTFNKIFVDLRNYVAKNEMIEAIMLIAETANVINQSIDKSISLLAMLIQLKDIFKRK